MTPSVSTSRAHWLPRPAERVAWTNILLLLALPLLAYAAHLFSMARSYDFYLLARCDRPVAVRLLVDRDAGPVAAESSAVHLPAPADAPQPVRFVPGGRLAGFRLQLDRAPGAVIHLDRAGIVARGGDGTVIPVNLTGLRSMSPQAARLVPESDGSVRVETAAGTGDPTGDLLLASPLELPFQTADFTRDLAATLLVYGLAAFGALAVWRRLSQRPTVQRRTARAAAGLESFYAAAVRAVRARPVAALWLTAALGVAVSCYPVVFFGRSFVSPNSSGFLLYDRLPTLPGSTDAVPVDPQGSDTGVALWQCVPYSVIEHRAIFRDHEFPLWNRYGSGGTSLLGQGQSMIGDPLHWLVVLAGGNSGAWDLKFLLARLVFAAGVGLAVRAATGRLAAALLLGFSACFLGFFAYRFNHPAYFSLCYAPWILYAWLEIARGTGNHRTPAEVRICPQIPQISADLRTKADRQISALPSAICENLRNLRTNLVSVRYFCRRSCDPQRTACFVGALLLANWCELNSGTAKEAALLLLGLNAAGLLVFLLSDAGSWRSKGRGFLGLLWAGACFVLLSAPLWRTLLEMVAHSWNDSQQARPAQLQPGLLIGLFDAIFYRQFTHGEEHLDPSLNFVVLLGLAFAATSWRTLVRQRVFLALGLGALLPFALAFGVISPSWIKALPFVGQIGHIDNTFSCVLIVLLLVLAGFGLERCREQLRAADWTLDYAGAVAVLAILLMMFFGLAQASQRSALNPLEKIGEVPFSPFFRAYTFSLVAAFLALPLLVWRLRRDRAAGAPGLVPWIAVCLGAMLWCGGLHLPGVVRFDRYVFHPPARVDLQTPSPAVVRLQALTRAEPGRCLGLGDNLAPGFCATYGLESPSGPDALQNRYYRQLLADSGQALRWHWNLVTNRDKVVARRRFYDLLGVRYYAASHLGQDHDPDPTPVPGLRPLGRADLDLYESETAWPRAFFTDTLTANPDGRPLYQLALAGDGRPFAVLAPGESTQPGAPDALPALLHGDDAARTIVSADRYRLTNHTTTFHLRAPGPGVAVLLEGYQDYHVRVSVNGLPARHFRVNEAFSGVYLPTAGNYEICYHYGPSDLGRLLGASAMGLAGLVAAAVWTARQPRPKTL